MRSEEKSDDRRDTAKDALHEALEPRESDELKSGAARLFDDFRRALAMHPYSRRGLKSGLHFARGWRAAAGLLVTTGLGCTIVAAVVLLGNSRVTWADVVERFKSVKSFSATVYRKEDATSQPVQYELWVGREGRVRVRVGNEVAFGEKGELTRAFDVEMREDAVVDRKAEGLVRMLGRADEFSFESLVSVFAGELSDVTPLVNADAVISNDMVVFDLVSKRTPEWMRIWALRESRLPVYVRVWDPRDSESTDVFFSYGKDQPDEFFDPDAFASALNDRSRKTSELAYLFLKDPGGRDVMPPKMDEAAAFKVVTTTLDGKPWSLADHRGKAVFLYFWVVDYPSPPDEWVYDVYRKFGDREDFVMAGVALGGDAAAVRTRCDQWDMQWPVLYEPGKGVSQNSLAKALGVIRTQRGIIIWKDGYIEEVFDPSLKGRVDGAVLGMTFESARWIRNRLSDLSQHRQGIDREYIKSLCGPPDTKDTVEEGKTREWWRYRRRNEDDTKEEWLNAGFDGEGTYTGMQAGSNLVDPARLEVYIGPEFWKREIEDKLDPSLLAGLGTQYEFCVFVGPRAHEYPSNKAELEEAREGHTWTLSSPFGTYNVSFCVVEKERYSVVWRLRLAEGVELARNEKKTLRFE